MRAQPVASRLIDQAVMNRVQSKLESVGNTQLIEDVVQMIFDCLLADEKLLADFSVTEALRHQLHNFLFAVAEQWFVPALSRRRRARPTASRAPRPGRPRPPSAQSLVWSPNRN